MKKEKMAELLGNIDEDLIEEGRALLISHAKPRRTHRAVWAVGIAAALVLSLTVGAAAAGVPGFRAWLFGSADMGEYLTEASAAGEANGFRAEVLGVMRDGGDTVAYFTLQDTENQDRLTETAYAVTNGQSQCVGYDPETQTALYRTTVDPKVEAIPGAGASENQLQIGRLVQAETTLENTTFVPTAADMTEKTLPIEYATIQRVVDGETETVAVYPLGESYFDEETGQTYEPFPQAALDYARDASGEAVVLAPGENALLEAGGAKVTAVGFVNGKLRAQLLIPGQGQGSMSVALHCADRGRAEDQWAEIEAGQSFGQLTSPEVYGLITYRQAGMTMFSLTEEGKVIFGGDMSEDYYLEYLYDIGADEVDQFEFYLTGDQSNRTEIGLQLPLPLSDSLEGGVQRITKREAPELPVSTVEITPLGVVLLGSREELSHITSLELKEQDRALAYRLADASRELYDDRFDFEPEDMSEGALFAHYVAQDLPADLEQIQAVRVNGVEVPIR